ncbi:hypothetical protein [Haloflavibacter putidus]|uniref:hypothetical protein n=1 Tax=Haloflavibacter putidus TaxID=2576776 RepID=UPI001F2610CC|nr:hypothetical protein [Haloflavibacter putidus]
MKSDKPIAFFGILFLAFGITYLDFDNFSVENNYKAYSAVLLGGILCIISLRNKLKAKK